MLISISLIQNYINFQIIIYLSNNYSNKNQKKKRRRNMQTIKIGKNLVNLKMFKKQRRKEILFSDDIMKEIEQSEREFEKGLEIPAEEVFQELREKYGF